jgi:transposase InsO family protein
MSQITARLPDELAEPDRAARQLRRTRGCIERFNGKLRDEFLNEHWFKTLHQARSAGDAARSASNTTQIDQACNPGLPQLS